jgi:hypothetical protein
VRVPACVRWRKWKQLSDMQPRFIVTIRLSNLSERTPTKWSPHLTIPIQRYSCLDWILSSIYIVNGTLSFEYITVVLYLGFFFLSYLVIVTYDKRFFFPFQTPAGQSWWFTR